MGAKESRESMCELENAKKDLQDHLDYLKIYENQILFRSTWENDCFYVISHTCNNNLTSKIYNKKLLYSSCKPDDTQECAICLDNIKKDACKIEGCNHMFHTKCLKKHIKMNDIACCPLCRGGNDMYAISQMKTPETYSYNSSSSYYSDN